MSEPKKRARKPRKTKPVEVPETSSVVMGPMAYRRAKGLPREDWRISIGADIAKLIHVSIMELSNIGLLQTDALELCLWPIIRWLNDDASDADLRASYRDSYLLRDSFRPDDGDDQWRRIDLGLHQGLAWSISRLAGALIFSGSDDGLLAQRVRSRMEFASILARAGGDPDEAAFRAGQSGGAA